MATVIIPSPLRKFTDNAAKITVMGNKVSDIIQELTTNFPDLKKHVINADGRIASFIYIFGDDNVIRSLEQEQTMVKENSTISIIPAIAGGIQ